MGLRTKQSHHGRHVLKHQFTIGQLIRLAFRLNSICNIVLYTVVSIQASLAVIRVLTGATNSSMSFKPEESSVFADYLGSGSIRESPLVKAILNDSTALRSDTLYLEANKSMSFVGCAAATFNEGIYGNVMQRSVYSIAAYTSAHVYPIFATTELILPIVDCAFPPTARGDTTYAQGNYLLRSRLNSDDIYVLSMRFSMQDYRIPEQNEVGPVGVVTFTLFNDMQSTTVTRGFLCALGYPYTTPSYTTYELVSTTDDGFWVLDSIPVNTSVESVKRIRTARRTGIYVGTEKRQSNIINQRWALDENPYDSITTWHWIGEPVLHDALSWPHLIHAVFAAETIINFTILLLLMSRNLRGGKIWVGDAFVSVSTMIIYRGVLIAITWAINSGWTIYEYALATATQVGSIQDMANLPVIIHADLMTLYLCAVHIVCSLLKERIDPGLALAIFEVSFMSRIEIIKCFPSMVKLLSDAATAERELSITNAGKVMAQWTSHKFASVSPSVIAVSLAPVGVSTLITIVISLLQKLYRKRFLKSNIPNSGASVEITDLSKTGSNTGSTAVVITEKRTLTLFEIATGAPLQDRYGVAAHYETCKFIKGIKFASADGIYSNGYVIANGKFLVATADLPVIAMTKLLRRRVRAIYVYNVNGYTVQQTARLVYPDTFTWEDLFYINISILN